MNERIRDIAEDCDFYVGNEHWDKSHEEQERLFLEKFAELIVRDVKKKMSGPSKYDKRRVLTKGKIIKALGDIPDDVPILINVEFANGENWDTHYAFIVDMSYMCPGVPGCTHTEPEMDYEVVLGVKFGHELGIMENLEDDNEDDQG